MRLPGTKTRESDRWLPLKPELGASLRELVGGREPDEVVFTPWTNVRRDLAVACARASSA